MRLAAAFTVLVLCASASAETLIVGNKAEDTVSFFDLESGREVARRETGRAPHEIAVSPDGTLAAVVSYQAEGYTGNTIHLFDVATAEKTGTIDLGESTAPHGLKWIPRTDAMIVTTEGSQEALIVRPRGGRVDDRIPTDQQGSHMIAVSPDGLTGYVANIGSGSFSVIDIPAADKRRDVTAGEGTEAIAVSPDGATIYVGNNESRSIMAFDARTLERQRAVETEGVPIRVEISPDGETMAASFYDRGEVAFYRTRDFKKLGTVDLGEDSVPVTLLYSPEGDRLWAAATGLAEVVEINPKRRVVIRRLDAGRGSDGLGYSEVDLTAD